MAEAQEEGCSCTLWLSSAHYLYHPVFISPHLLPPLHRNAPQHPYKATPAPPSHRRLYVQQYFEALERGGDPREDVEIRRMDAELEEGVALLFRKLAQARWMGEQARRGRMKKEQEAQARQSWMGWLG